jgi:REP element-mobilizing transposase RayT
MGHPYYHEWDFGEGYVSLNKGRYRIESTRLKDWDYTAAGYYYITICTKERIHFFGSIEAGEMRLSPVGEIVAEEWQKTPHIRPNVELDAWVIMPNHLHSIIILKTFTDDLETPRQVVSSRRGVSTTVWKPHSLGFIINQIKSICTKRIHTAGYGEFAWQSNYYEHIIRDEIALQEIRQYILQNPLTWEHDNENLHRKSKGPTTM